MKHKINLYKEIFNRRPELKNTYIIAQRIDAMIDHIKLALEDLPEENKKVSDFYIYLIEECKKAFEEQCSVFGSCILTMVDRDSLTKYNGKIVDKEED